MDVAELRRWLRDGWRVPGNDRLLLARSADVGAAVIGTGMLLGVKRLAVVLLAPIGGHAADHFGARAVTTAGLAVAAVGAVGIGAGQTIIGAVLLSCGAAVTTTTIPAATAATHGKGRVGALAFVGMSRDAGAALGPLVALASFDVTEPAVTYWTAALLLGTCATISALGAQIEF